MKPITYLQSKQVIKSPIPFIPFAKLTKKPTRAFYLNLSSDFNKTSSTKCTAKNKDSIMIIDNYNTNPDKTQSSRLDTKDSTNNKLHIGLIKEEDAAESSISEQSISFSAFIIPTNESEPIKTFSSICKNINLFESKIKKSKVMNKPILRRRTKTSVESELKKGILKSKEDNKQFRITNNILIDKAKFKNTKRDNATVLGRVSPQIKKLPKIIPKPFILYVNSANRRKRNEMQCCACNAPLTKRKNITQMCHTVNNSINYHSNKMTRNMAHSKICSNLNLTVDNDIKGCITQR